jgi:tetratricopeptide (TPR) repeat protein
MAGAIAAVFVILAATSATTLSMYLLGESARTDAIVAQEAEAEQRRVAEEREQRARQREAEATTSREAEAAQRRAAETALVQTRELARLLIDSALSQAETGHNTGELHVLLDRTVDRIEEDLADQPNVLADLRRMLAETYWRLGDSEGAEPLFRAVVEHHRDVDDVRSTEFAAILGLHAETMWGDPAAQEALLREALSIYREHSDEDGREVLATQIPLGGVLLELNRLDEAESTLREAIRRSEELGGDDGRWRSEKYSRLAEVMDQRGDAVEAERLHRQALAVAREEPEHEHEQLIQALENLADFLRGRRELTEAAELYREMYDLHRASFGPDYRGAIDRAMKLAEVLHELGDEAGAEAVLAQHLAYCRAALSEDHGTVVDAVRRIAWFFPARGRLERADEVLEEHVKRCRDQLGPDGDDAHRALSLLGRLYNATIRHELAVPVLREGLRPAADGDRLDASDHVIALGDLHSSLLALGRTDEARDAGAELIAFCADLAAREELEPVGYPVSYNGYAWLLLTIEPEELRDPATALPVAEKAVEMSERQNPDVLDTLAVAHSMLGNLDEAIAIEREALALAPWDWQLNETLAGFLRQKGEDEPAEPLLREALAKSPLQWSVHRERLTDALDRLLAGRGETEAAEQLWRETVAAHRANAPDDRVGLSTALIYYGERLLANGKLAEAETALRESLALRREVMEPGHALIANAMSFLGEALAGQGAFEEAEVLLIEGYEQLRDRAWQFSVAFRDRRRQESIQRLIDLYDAWDRPEQAARWRTALTELSPGAAAAGGSP